MRILVCVVLVALLIHLAESQELMPSSQPTRMQANESVTMIPSMQAQQAEGDVPTVAPSVSPSLAPTQTPTQAPTQAPTFSMPTSVPSLAKTGNPTLSPTTLAPSLAPTETPTSKPSPAPSTMQPTSHPSSFPSAQPTARLLASNSGLSPFGLSGSDIAGISAVCVFVSVMLACICFDKKRRRTPANPFEDEDEDEEGANRSLPLSTLGPQDLNYRRPQPYRD